MFEIIEKKTNDLSVVQIKNITTDEYVSIVPRFGTAVNAFNNREGLIISDKFEASYGVKLL